MGQYLNPDNVAFKKKINSKIYVDKSGLLSLLNERICTSQNMICSTRPRRFGKSMAVQMIAAYYGIAEDSSKLFAHSKIAKDRTYDKHRNQYDVLQLDMVVMCSRIEKKEQLIPTIQESVFRELQAEYGIYIQDISKTIESALMDIHLATGKQFVILVDEWDAVFRLYKDDDTLQRAYIDFLRSLFKGSSADRFVALAYITGILPIKKYGTQSAMNNFDEFTMLAPRIMKEYIGFTETEVKELCQQYSMDFEKAKEWYDGYVFRNNTHIYSPKSVVDAMTYQEFSSYWTSTETFETLKDYITMNFEGLKDDIIRMLAGEKVSAYTGTFTNDIVSFDSRDDVLTVLIHLGYLAYDEEEGEVYIPNKEVRGEFVSAIRSAKWNGVMQALEQSKKLLKDTLNKNADVVAERLEKIHDENISILTYDENSLSLVITLAYFAAKDEYITIRELPSGKGYADVVFLPRKSSTKPAIVVELKCDKSPEGAIAQIKERNYGSALSEYVGKVLLVGINYEKDAKKDGYKKHSCVIEEWEK